MLLNIMFEKQDSVVRSDIKSDVVTLNSLLNLLPRTLIEVANVFPMLKVCALLLFPWI